MHNADIVVIGGSAGARKSVISLIRGLPSDLDATLFVVLHLAATGEARLAEEIQRATGLQVETPDGEQAIEHGHIYVTSPDHHLIVRQGKVVSSRGPRENMWRPALDVLFRTAAVAYGSRVIGILLSGELDDGTAGLQAIKACGGIVIVQDPQDAAFPAMPETALANVHVDHRVRLADMAALVARRTKEPAGPSIPISDALRREAQMAEEQADTAALHDGQEPPTSLSCPECSGPLWRSGPGGEQFRCLVGHAYHLDSLLQGADLEIDRTVWAAIRLFEQRANISRMMSERERSHGRAQSSKFHDSRADESHQHAQKLRQLHARRETSRPE